MKSKLLLAIILLGSISFASVLADSGQLSVVSGSTYHIDYKTKDATIQNVQANKDSLSLDFSVLATSPVASVELTMPRDLIDAKNSDGSDEVFIVLVDGTFATYTETSTTPQARTILIQLSQENKDVEIIGTSLGTTKLVSQNNTQQTTPVPQKPIEQQIPKNQTVTTQPVPTVPKNNTQNTGTSPDVFQQFTSMLNIDSSNLPLNLDKKQLVEYSIIAAIVIVIIIVITSSVKKSNHRKIRNN